MTRDELDTLWQQALHESVRDGENFIRYHFAALVAAHERDACAKLCDAEKGIGGSETWYQCANELANQIRAKGNNE